MRPNFLTSALTLTLLLSGTASAGPLGYGICQAGCSVLVCSCYAAAGLVFGTVVAAPAAPAAALACNSAFGSCQAACAVALLAPTL